MNKGRAKELENFFTSEETGFLMNRLLSEAQPLDRFLKDQLGVVSYGELGPELRAGMIFGLSREQVEGFISRHPGLEAEVSQVFNRAVRWKVAKEEKSRRRK